MSISRRNILQFIAGARLAPDLFAKSLVTEVDRLAGQYPARAANVFVRQYRASATITLLSMPLVSRAGVGSGFIAIEEAPGSGDKALAIQFGAGSWPDRAHGLNRLGFIREVVVERAGQLDESAYFGFMTTSPEKSLGQAQKNLAAVGATIPYVAAQAAGRRGEFHSSLYRISLPSQLTWREYPELAGKVRDELSAGFPAQSIDKKLPTDESLPATFLCAVRKALIAEGTHGTQAIIYNGKSYTLQTTRTPDLAAGTRFVQRELARDGGRVMRMDATLREEATDHATAFKLWFESGGAPLPLAFEYQARSFLRLTFEYDPSSQPRSVELALSGIPAIKDKN